MWCSRALTIAILCYIGQASGFADNPSTRSANHIFNAIHSSMRQWGSSLNHNGMSIFPATIPKGTKLYHGKDMNTTVEGLEWVAFERDHALNFARLLLTPNPGRPGSYEKEDQSWQASVQQSLSRLQRSDLRFPLWQFPGYLQIYETRKDLHLLYLDGSSAAKTSWGTLDLQDVLLLNTTGGRLDAEHERAQALCRLARDEWHGRIDGFIRMEAGFEIIICSFVDSLGLIEAQRTESLWASDTIIDWQGVAFHWLRAAANRFDGIGGMPSRVRLDYDNFFTAYAYDFDPSCGHGRLPRLGVAPKDILETMQRDAATMISNYTSGTTRDSHNWRAATDMIVQKYADPLQFLTTSPQFVESDQELFRELTYMLRPYIDTSHRQREVEIRRCTFEFVPLNAVNAGPAGRSILEVSTRICSTLFNTLWSLRLNPKITANPSHPKAHATDHLTSLQELVDWLSWTIWKKCKGCGWNEICSIPMFPFGYAEDHENPKCRNEDDFKQPMDYWVVEGLFQVVA